MSMTAQEQPEVLSEVRAALELEPRINLHQFPLLISRDASGTLFLEGETENIAAKKVVLEVAASTPGVTGVVDRLHVAPVRRMADSEICDYVCDSLRDEPALENYTVRKAHQWSRVREPDHDDGLLEVSVEDGVVTLRGTVKDTAHKSLAGVLAWWVSGTRDVVNGLEVDPPRPISDAEIAAAIRLVLEKDPLVEAAAIRVLARNSVVVLEGYVANRAEKEMAEMNAWYVVGVDFVINRLEIRQ